jgi:hypothetical protein
MVFQYMNGKVYISAIDNSRALKLTTEYALALCISMCIHFSTRSIAWH